MSFGSFQILCRCSSNLHSQKFLFSFPSSTSAFFNIPRVIRLNRAAFKSSIATTRVSPGMNDRDQAPYHAQDPKEVSAMLDVMHKHATSGKRKGPGGFSCKKKTFKISDGSGRSVDSWQCQDWDYKKDNLPTYARGLFTHNNNGKPEIAVRGYDKFFNVGEVKKTEWKNVETNTRGPYELSVKENGCIIFIAGLDDETLLITSKHSTGERGDASASHAMNGDKWIDKQLKQVGKTRADLAKRLRSMNATAVAELCDDAFEEHVLAYGPDVAGLYLHGINLNLPEFATYPGNQVHKFADEWAFRRVMFVVKDDIRDVKPFLEKVAETGNYDGRDTEGFVIRCQARETSNSPWEDWFFKYKFEEPYLMYRQWRECTKAVIGNRMPKFKKHKKITEEYLLYARRQMAKNPGLAQDYNHNHGIIAMRDGFLAEKGIKGSDIIQSEIESGAENALDATKNIVLVPVATIGCGKTTVATALTRLFDWGHEQNDNIMGKGNRAGRFTMATTNSLALHPVMIADRNNHQRREREQIIKDVQAVIPDARFVALHWVHDRGDYDKIRKAMQDRIFERGDKHQTIHADSKSRDEIIGIMDGFLGRFEPVDATRSPDDDFDLVIDLDPTATSRENLETVVHKLHGEFPKLFDMPSDEAMDKAIEKALNVKDPIIKHDLGRSSRDDKHDKHAQDKRDSRNRKENKFKQNQGDRGSVDRQSNGNGTPTPKKLKAVEYFGISLPTDRVSHVLDAVFSSADSEESHFYQQLKSSKRLQSSFHVTLMHRASIAQNPDLWNRMTDLHHHHVVASNHDSPFSGPDLGTVGVYPERVVWDDRVMAIVVRLPDAEDESRGAFKSVNDVAHVTVGTAAEGIKPKESNDLLLRWSKGDVEQGESGGKVRECRVKGNVVLEGVVRATMSR